MSTNPQMASDRGADELDNLVWHALSTVHARFSRSNELARVYDPDVSQFVAIRQQSAEAWSALAVLVGPAATVIMGRPDPVEPSPGWDRLGGLFGHQMVLDSLGPRPELSATIEALSEEHVPQIIELVELTQPGPFRPRTTELGNYYGVFDEGQLVAMAGERLQTPSFAEVSAVCTHPSARGRGLAAALTHHVATGIVDRGAIPVLHVAEANENARRVYTRLGFVVSRRLEFVGLRSPDTPADRGI